MNIITTERLTLRTWQESDLEKMYKINQDSHVMEFFPNKINKALTRKFILAANSQFDKLGYTFYAV